MGFVPSFVALIKHFNIKSLISGDSEGEILLRFRLNKEEFKKLIDIYDAQQEVEVTIGNLK